MIRLAYTTPLDTAGPGEHAAQLARLARLADIAPDCVTFDDDAATVHEAPQPGTQPVLYQPEP